MTLAFVTFGCRLNRAEALEADARARAAGHAVVTLDRAAETAPDVIVVRGCSVTAKAQHACERTIEGLRARYPRSRVVVTGCLPGAEPFEIPGAPTAALAPSGQTSRAYLKIQDGCAGRCAFCTVPLFRGPPRSVPFAEVCAAAQRSLAAGFRELVVTGCNLALYRSDGKGLADVLSALAACGTDHRVRLGSLEPGVCDAAVLDAFSAHANICRFLHLSVQSGSAAVLARMNRPYGPETLAALCDEARRRFGPSLALGCDVITGFPGETEADFDATRTLIERYAFSNLHVFPYSERPGTAAVALDGVVPVAVRRARARALDEIGRAQRAAFAASFVGKTVRVCIERGGTGGWTEAYVRCCVTTPDGTVLPRRALVEARVERVRGDVLIART